MLLFVFYSFFVLSSLMSPLTVCGYQSYENLQALNGAYFTPDRYQRHDAASASSLYTSGEGTPLLTRNPNKNGQSLDQNSPLTTRGQRETAPSMGGPGQPEMSSFKSVSTNNLVNLFTGDFNYNIPLLDVGGYPINIYYEGGITMEQEPSWVGLGWNINPGNINRNVRGVPDDFNGQDTLKQMQTMKPNKTWGLGIGADAELFGIKAPIDANLGVAFNNYLGPSLDLALRGNAALKIGMLASSEKGQASMGAGMNIGIDVNSRSGTSFSGNVSLTANATRQNNTATFGVGLSTSYNSRIGIKSLQIAEQASFSSNDIREAVNKRTGELVGYNAGGHINETLYSNSISFTKPSYIPSLRMPLTNTAWSGHFQLGLGMYGVATDVEAEVYGQKSEIAAEDTLQRKPMVGYLYYQNAVNHPDYVMDFTRFNDREVTPNTPVISVPQYTYDVFSIQGEGTGGSIRAFRNDLGYVRDNITTSKDKNFSLGGDVDPPGHYGGNFNTVKTPSTIGEWNTGNKLRNSIQFRNANQTFENVYFRNPGENCVLDSNRFKQVGGTDLVRFVLAGSNNSPTVEAKLQRFNSLLQPNSTLVDLSATPVITQRNKRTQVISFLTADEASHAGLDTIIKNYNNKTFLDNVTDTLIYQAIPRVGSYRKPHHISQINVTENNGKRYVYGIPVYNTLQQDFTFSVNNSYLPYSPPDTVSVSNSAELYHTSPLLNDNSSRDGYVQITTTPPYAHSFLLSGILSPDYVDVTGNGITEDDLGQAVKFNYTRIEFGNDTVHRWRTPLSGDNSANFNGGSRSEVKDDKGIICYGERESWYLSSVESKTMIALFYTSKKPNDGKGPRSVYGGINTNDTLLRKLDSIALFNKADLKKNGLASAKPVKTVHFGYGNELCQNTPDNISTVAGSKGKLTLDSIWFTYNGTTRIFKNKYRFSYGVNPDYAAGASDRWGNYKPASMNPGESDKLKNSDYPYSIQDPTQKATIDQNASAWMLNKIVLPAGGEINVSYETDDYAWVQNKRAAEMMNIVGFGNTSSYSSATDRLYPFTNPSSIENDYVFIKVPVACSDTVEVHNRYLQGMTQLAFKIWVLMPKGPEYITCYASYNSCGVVSTNHNIIWVKMNRLAGKSPLSVTTLEYLRQQLPGQAFKGYDVSGEPGLKQVGDMLLGMLTSLRDAFTDPINAFRKDGKAMHTDLTKCFVRLNDPDGFKYGGGYRVKSVILKDNWDSMTGQYAASYGQKYDYTTTENFNGAVRRISSGVASYEPSIGGEENPFHSIVQVEDYLPAGPASFGAVEMPVMDAFFPAPLVGYSKVTVTPIKFDTTKKSRSGIGKQVTEFYTAKDFPVYYAYTPFDAGSVKEFHQASTQAFFNKYAYDFKAQSQGFLIATNDMHGKMKSQSSYAENDTTTRISYTENFYKNTGVNGLNDKFSFIGKDNKGSVYSGNMGIDVDLMTDTREFSVKSTSLEVQGQVDMLYFIVPIPVPTIWPVSGTAQNIYRSVTTSKVITYHSVLDSVVVIDKGSQVSTKNLAYDAETGEVLVTRTNNEFDKPVYNTSYPAYWAYGGMGLAYKNIDAVYSNIKFSDGKLTTAGFDFSIFESGDELLIKKATRYSGCNGQVNDGGTELIWAFDKNKNTTSLITTPDFIFIDSKGRPYTMDAVTFRIIRSGHRNLLDAKTASVTSMVNPISTGKLKFDTASKVINASATEFKEKWLVDNDIFKRLRSVRDPVTCTTTEVSDSLGYLETNINPYRKGLVGNFKPYRNMVFYDTRKEYDTSSFTNISANGYLNNFKPYWDFNTSNKLVPDSNSLQWVWNSKLNKTNAKGMELETVNALGIYTSAQYGYNKTMPVAIANNAGYNEMFAEGFEDYGYGESINNTTFNFFNRHINFNGLPNSAIINTDTTNFKAHTGRYALKVNGSSTSSLSIPVLSEPDSTFSPVLIYKKDTTGVLSTLGGNYNFESTVPKYVPTSNQGTASFSSASPGLTLSIDPLDTIYSGARTHYYHQSGSFYINISSAKTYSFNISLGTAYNNYGITVNAHYNDFGVYIYDSTGKTASSYSLQQVAFDYTSASYTAFLCPGVYLVNYYADELYSATDNGLNYTHNSYSWSCSNSTSPDYKNLTKTTGCIFTRPIAASKAMQNPVFSIPANKKMLFTAWVRENCGDPANGITCRDSTYTYNRVQFNFGTGSNYEDTLYPSGPIIDGWQRYEGSFIAPATSTGMTLSLINTGPTPVYFDDFRIQPFNSNLKSYVYDPVNLRLKAELDANNYATFYDYDEEGTLIRTKVETREGIKTVTETRSFLQRVVH
jgi:hypothetical protein